MSFPMWTTYSLCGGVTSMTGQTLILSGGSKDWMTTRCRPRRVAQDLRHLPMPTDLHGSGESQAPIFGRCRVAGFCTTVLTLPMKKPVRPGSETPITAPPLLLLMERKQLHRRPLGLLSWKSNQKSKKMTLQETKLNPKDYDWVLVWERDGLTTQLPSPPDRPLSTKAIVIKALKGMLGFGIKKFLGL